MVHLYTVVGLISENNHLLGAGSISVNLVSSFTGLNSPNKKICYLYVVKLLNTNQLNWRPSVQ